MAPTLNLLLDTHDLDAAVAFYRDRLGFKQVDASTSAGPGATRTIACDRFPSVTITFRDCLPRPPIGTCLGSLARLTFEVPDPDAVAAGLNTSERRPAEGPADRVTVADPTGYRLVLVRSSS
jgi:catechol 2,3-dioxygenase-like lactoylglutathione lyase family enzyme